MPEKLHFLRSAARITGGFAPVDVPVAVAVASGTAVRNHCSENTACSCLAPEIGSVGAIAGQAAIFELEGIDRCVDGVFFADDFSYLSGPNEILPDQDTADDEADDDQYYRKLNEREALLTRLSQWPPGAVYNIPILDGKL